MSSWIPLYTPHNFYPPLFTYPMPYTYTFPYISATSFFLPELEGLSYLQNNLEKSQNKKPENKSRNVPKQVQSKADVKKSKNSEGEVDKSKGKEVRKGRNDFFPEVTPMNKEIEGNDMKNLVEMLSSKETLADPISFSDEDFTDYDENDALGDLLPEVDYKDKKDRANETEDKKETESPEERVVFNEFVPASGKVRIAARF